MKHIPLHGNTVQLEPQGDIHHKGITYLVSKFESLKVVLG